MRGARDVELGDHRVLALGRLLNVPDDECFAYNEPDSESKKRDNARNQGRRS